MKISENCLTFLNIAAGLYANGLGFHFIGQLTKAQPLLTSLCTKKCVEKNHDCHAMQNRCCAATAIAIATKRQKACKCTATVHGNNSAAAAPVVNASVSKDA